MPCYLCDVSKVKPETTEAYFKSSSFFLLWNPPNMSFKFKVFPSRKEKRLRRNTGRKMAYFKRIWRPTCFLAFWSFLRNARIVILTSSPFNQYLGLFLLHWLLKFQRSGVERIRKEQTSLGEGQLHVNFIFVLFYQDCDPRHLWVSVLNRAVCVSEPSQLRWSHSQCVLWYSLTASIFT